MKAIITVSLIATTGLAIAFALCATCQLNELIATSATLDGQRSAARARAADMEHQLAATRERLAQIAEKGALATAPSTSTPVDASSVDHNPQARAVRERRLSPETMIANDSRKLAEYARTFRETLDLTWGGMFKAFRLSPEQIEKFKDLKVAEEQQRLELIAAAESKGLSRQSEAYRRLDSERGLAARQREREFFGGGQQAKEYLEWRDLRYLRATTQRLASSEMFPIAPITAAQVEDVTRILASHSDWKPGRQAWSSSHWTTITWDAAGDQLQAVLSPAQLATLRLIMRPAEASTASERRYAELQAKAREISRQPAK